MKKDTLLANITDSFHMIAIYLNIDKFVPRGLICHIVKQLGKINNFTLTELNVLLSLFVMQLKENNNTK